MPTFNTAAMGYSLCENALIPLVMAERAINTGLLLAMAIHAPAHRQIGCPRKLRPRRHRTMAFLASIRRRNMFPMAEIHKTRNFIYTNPPDLPIIFTRMASSTNLRLRQRHRLPRIRIRMAGRTLQLQVTRMDLMAVRHRLLRSLLARRQRTTQQQKDTNELLHRLPLRISSAM